MKEDIKEITEEQEATNVGDILEDLGGIVHKTIDLVKDSGKVVATSVSKAKDKTVEVLDQDKNGTLDSNDLILMALKMPGAKISREKFLNDELINCCDKQIVDEAIKTTPNIAGIPQSIIDKIANDVIKVERNNVSGISAGLGIPGGVAMAATIPADIAQYYAFMLRAAQKLMYLYGFQELDENLKVNSSTVNQLTICLGIMNGVAGANNAIKGIAKAMATGVEKKLINTALTKGTIYPIVKSVARFFGARMTKEVFAGFFKKAIPIVGGVVGGGLTFATFKPCCERLKNALQDTMLSNNNHKSDSEEEKMFKQIKTGAVDVELID